MGERKVSDRQVADWAAEFNSTEQQVRDAIEAVGTGPGDIEMHLNGSRSSSNRDKMKDAGL